MAPRATAVVNAGSAASPPTTSTSSGTAGGAGAVDHPHRLAAAEQGFKGGEADRAGAEDDVTRGAGHARPHDAAFDARGVGRGGAHGRQQPVQQQPGQGGEGDGTAGAEDGELFGRRESRPEW